MKITTPNPTGNRIQNPNHQPKRPRLAFAPWLLAAVLLVPRLAGAQLDVLTETFESAFPGSVWTVGNTGSGPTWRDVNTTFGGEGTQSGGWKGYCAGTAYPFNSNEPNPSYTDNMSAFMETDLNLRFCENRVLLRFWSKIPSIEARFDHARVYMDGNLLWSHSAAQTSWTEITLDLSSYAGGIHTLRFQFESDVSNTAEGWYLDDITVTAYDTLPPTVTCPGNFILDVDPGQCSKSNVVFTVSTSDNCPGETLSCNPPSGSTFPAGQTTVVCAAKDAAGNVSQCSFTVTVRDTPVITCPSNLVVYACAATTPVTFTVVASNQCVSGTRCVVPDNGGGTANLPPPGCEYGSETETLHIIDGLPVGTTIEIPAVLKNFTCGTGVVSVCSFPAIPGICMVPGGSLAGERGCSGAILALDLVGTGTLAGYNRSLPLPVGMEIHIAPRTNGAPVQSFDTDMFRLFGQITSDPDFDLLRITGGTDFGMPSPGHTTLTAQGTNWVVDSFFDITYRIDFVGAPGGPLAGRSGSTTGTIRLWTGANPPPKVTCTPPSGSYFPVGTNLVTCVATNIWGASTNCSFSLVVLPDNRPPMLTCPTNLTVQTCSNNFPVTFTLIASNHCGYGANCSVPDNGLGTADLPPFGCQYVSPSGPMYIRDGLPPGTTIQMPPVLWNFACGPVPVCSFLVSTGTCMVPGGSLGGERGCSGGTLTLYMTGSGLLAGFNRTIHLPLSFETHSTPRTNGAPVQSFDTDMFRLFGQITLDPDFDLLRITGGTDFGMPSPGHTTLTRQLDGTWSVDSFFDLIHRIDFVGNPGGPLAGYSGSTVATNRLRTGAGLYPTVYCTPPSGSLFPLGTNVVSCTASNQWGSTNCNFLVTVTATRPVLSVSRRLTNILLHWPEACSTYQLQSTPQLAPPITWTDVLTAPVHVGAEWQVLVTPSSSNQFFRLKLLP